MDDHIERELLLMKVKIRIGAAQTLLELIKNTGARVLDDCPETYTLELTGATNHMDEFISKVGECSEILAVLRSGAMAISRGRKILSSTI